MLRKFKKKSHHCSFLGTIKVELVDAEKKCAKGKCIAHRCKGGRKDDEITFSELFVLGYR